MKMSDRQNNVEINKNKMGTMEIVNEENSRD